MFLHGLPTLIYIHSLHFLWGAVSMWIKAFEAEARRIHFVREIPSGDTPFHFVH